MPTQEFFSFDDDEAAPVEVLPGLVLLPPRHAVLRPELAVKVLSKRDGYLEQIRRDMEVIRHPERFNIDDVELFERRVEQFRQAIKALDAESQSPASS